MKFVLVLITLISLLLGNPFKDKVIEKWCKHWWDNSTDSISLNKYTYLAQINKDYYREILHDYSFSEKTLDLFAWCSILERGKGVAFGWDSAANLAGNNVNLTCHKGGL
jgi:hypothetical protein